MARETINSLKKKHQKELSLIKKAVWLKCADCRGYFIDGNDLCKNSPCPLRKYFPKKQTTKSVSFKKEIAKLAANKKNDEVLINLILPKEKPKQRKKGKSK
jgi:hypothetical protein